MFIPNGWMSAPQPIGAHRTQPAIVPEFGEDVCPGKVRQIAIFVLGLGITHHSGHSRRTVQHGPRHGTGSRRLGASSAGVGIPIFIMIAEQPIPVGIIFFTLPGNHFAHRRPEVAHELPVTRPGVMPPDLIHPIGRIVFLIISDQRWRYPSNTPILKLHGPIKPVAFVQGLVVATPFLAIPTRGKVTIILPIFAQPHARPFAVILRAGAFPVDQRIQMLVRSMNLECGSSLIPPCNRLLQSRGRSGHQLVEPALGLQCGSDITIEPRPLHFITHFRPGIRHGGIQPGQDFLSKFLVVGSDAPDRNDMVGLLRFSGELRQLAISCRQHPPSSIGVTSRK